METKAIATQLIEYKLIRDVYYDDDGRIWVLIEDKNDLKYCEPFPEVDGINYHVVDDSRRIPASAYELTR